MSEQTGDPVIFKMKDLNAVIERQREDALSRLIPILVMESGLTTEQVSQVLEKNEFDPVSLVVELTALSCGI